MLLGWEPGTFIASWKCWETELQEPTGGNELNARQDTNVTTSLTLPHTLRLLWKWTTIATVGIDQSWQINTLPFQACICHTVKDPVKSCYQTALYSTYSQLTLSLRCQIDRQGFKEICQVLLSNCLVFYLLLANSHWGYKWQMKD